MLLDIPPKDIQNKMFSEICFLYSANYSYNSVDGTRSVTNVEMTENLGVVNWTNFLTKDNETDDCWIMHNFMNIALSIILHATSYTLTLAAKDHNIPV